MSDEFKDEKNFIQDLKDDWFENLKELTVAKETLNSDDIFASIHFLDLCDQLRRLIVVGLKEIELKNKHLEEFRNKHPEKKGQFEPLFADLQALKEDMKQKMEMIDEEYPLLAESTLRYVQDIIAKFSDAIHEEKVTPSINSELRQGLEKELYLQELSDSLESYREAREDFIIEQEWDYIQTLSEETIEENEVSDSIVSQLDTAITACNTALLIRESTD